MVYLVNEYIGDQLVDWVITDTPICWLDAKKDADFLGMAYTVEIIPQ